MKTLINKIKGITLLLCMLLIMPVMADTMPFYTSSIPKDAIGMYQTGKEITLYSKPEENADVIKKIPFTYKHETMPDGMFAVLFNDKRLGFLYVSDIGDDNWVEVIYDKHSGARGWVQTEDRFQFLPWLSFYNMYGKKYGLRLLKDAPEESKILRAKSEDNSQSVDKLNYVKQIKLTALRGNWGLVSVIDVDKTPKTGYLKWRSNEGTIYAFPNLK